MKVTLCGPTLAPPPGDLARKMALEIWTDLKATRVVEKAGPYSSELERHASLIECALQAAREEEFARLVVLYGGTPSDKVLEIGRLVDRVGNTDVENYRLSRRVEELEGALRYCVTIPYRHGEQE